MGCLEVRGRICRETFRKKRVPRSRLRKTIPPLLLCEAGQIPRAMHHRVHEHFLRPRTYNKEQKTQLGLSMELLRAQDPN